MTNEERIDKLEKIVREFNLAVDGANIQGGFPEMPTLPPSASLEQKLERLENAHKEFSIRGGVNVTVEGSFEHGFAICSTCPSVGQGTGSVIPSPTPPPPMPPCNGCGFDAFDGSGRKFLTRTITSSGNDSFDGPPFCPENVATCSWSSTKIETIDTNTCDVICISCHGTADCTVQFCSDPPCTTTLNASCGNPVNPCAPTPSILFDSSGCDWDNVATCSTAQCIACFNVSGDETVNSATEKTITWDDVVTPTTFVHATSVVTLSDECTP